MANKFVEFFKKLFKKTDDFRELLEDKLADYLEKINNDASIDEAEKEAIKTAIDFAAKYYGITIDERVTEAIGDEVVKTLGKLNKKLQTQLRK